MSWGRWWEKLGFSSNMQEETADWTDEEEEVGKEEEEEEDWEEELEEEVGVEEGVWAGWGWRGGGSGDR